jgi:hypothetical protein
MCECSSQRPGEVIAKDFIDFFITHNFRLHSVPNKTPNLPTEKAFPKGKFLVDVKEKDAIRKFMKYIDRDVEDFCTSILLGRNQQRGPDK